MSINTRASVRPIVGEGCTSISLSQLPAGLPVSPYGSVPTRRRLPNAQPDGKIYCANDDGLTRGPNGGTIGKVGTQVCGPKAQRWQAYAGGAYFALCRPSTLRYCTDLPGGPGYMASCMGTDETVTGDAEVYENYVLMQQTSTGWANYLNFKATPVAGKTGQYVQDRYNGLRYLTRHPGKVYDSTKFAASLSYRQLWDLY